MHVRMLTFEGEVVRLVFACAWCPKSSYKKLKRNERYSHGICDKHLREQLQAIKHSGKEYYAVS